MVIFVGCGGHAEDLAAIAYRCGEPNIRYIEETDPVTLENILRYGSRYLLAMNDARTRERLDTDVARAIVLLDPTAQLTSHVFSPGVVVGAHTTIGPKVKLGRHTHVNANCFITRATIGDYCTISPGATICGDVVIGDGVTVGAGATISNLCTIGHHTVIGAGAVVPPNTEIPPNQTWVGVPARQVVPSDYKTFTVGEPGPELFRP